MKPSLLPALLLIPALLLLAFFTRSGPTALARTGAFESPLPTPTVVIAQPGRPIFGWVLLPGRRDFSGTAVYFSPESCDRLTGPPTGSASIITTSDGYFEMIRWRRKALAAPGRCNPAI
jgi:hypothetical protein